MVNNTLTKTQPGSEVVEYKASGEVVSLSTDIIKQYLCGGNTNVTDAEAMMFLNLCRYQHLNPFLREAYLIKYGNSPATMVVGKETFVKRARAQSDFDGFEAGLTVMDKDGNIVERQGSLRAPTDQVLGGWAKVYIKGMRVPYYAAVEWGEYAGRDRNGNLNSMWASKGMTMIRKVALSQALREAYPEQMGGLYEPEEINSIPEELPTKPVSIPKGKQNEAAKKPEPEVIEAMPEADPDEDAVANSLFG